MLKKIKQARHCEKTGRKLEPKSGLCDCGRTVYLQGFDNTCACGRNYTIGGAETY